MRLKVFIYLLTIFCTITSNLSAMEQPEKVALTPEKQLAETKGITWYILSRYGADSDNSEGILPPAVIESIINHEKQPIVEQIKQLSDYIPIPCIHTPNKHNMAIELAAYNHDNTQSARSSWKHTILLYNPNTGQDINRLQGHDEPIKSIAYNHDGTQLASGSWDKSIKLWNPQNGKCTHTLNGHTNWVLSVAYNHDSTQLASGSEDNTIKLWNPRTGQCMHTLQGHISSIKSVVYNHNSTQLASGSSDGTIKLWDLKTRQCIYTLQGYTDEVYSITYNHDGTQLTSRSDDQIVKLWDLTIFNAYRSLDSLTLEQATLLLQRLERHSYINSCLQRVESTYRTMHAYTTRSHNSN